MARERDSSGMLTIPDGDAVPDFSQGVNGGDLLSASDTATIKAIDETAMVKNIRTIAVLLRRALFPQANREAVAVPFRAFIIPAADVVVLRF